MYRTAPANASNDGMSVSFIVDIIVTIGSTMFTLFRSSTRARIAFPAESGCRTGMIRLHVLDHETIRSAFSRSDLHLPHPLFSLSGIGTIHIIRDFQLSAQIYIKSSGIHILHCKVCSIRISLDRPDRSRHRLRDRSECRLTLLCRIV